MAENLTESEILSDCPQCSRAFPAELITAMCVNGDYVSTCPLCALRITNELHGMPEGTPFRGEIAQEMHKQAVAFDKSRPAPARKDRR